MDFAGSTVDPGPVLPDFRRCAFASPSRGTKSVHQEESYVDALVKASLQLVRKGLPVEVQCHGVRMLLVVNSTFLYRPKIVPYFIVLRCDPFE